MWNTASSSSRFRGHNHQGVGVCIEGRANSHVAGDHSFAVCAANVGGTDTLDVTDSDADEVVLIEAHRPRDGDLARIAVQDTGVGISKETLQRVMEPLFTTKARGIGLGLAISRAIVEKHNGKLTASSEVGQGTTFTIRLPRAVIEK
jgi:signal transduction histidine kinase